MEQQGAFFRLVDPEDYAEFGIDPRDVPMGTFASEDHPSFLPSRAGGNAYGLGLFEQTVLSRTDTDFLESVDFDDIADIIRNASKLNGIYRKLGLLIRFSSTGKRYFLIPINLVAHSLQEIKSKADEVEELIIRHIFETRRERLDIGILTTSQDLLVHELTARLSSHRIFILDKLEKLRSWRTPLDIVVLPKDPSEYILEQQLPRVSKRTVTQKKLMNYAVYLAGKLYDILKPDGKLHVLSHAPAPWDEQICRVQFKSEEDLKFFLLYSHTFKTKRRYVAVSTEGGLEVYFSDLHYYLNRFALTETQTVRILEHRRPEEVPIEEINALPYLNIRVPSASLKEMEKRWRAVFDAYFSTDTLKSKAPRHHCRYWAERIEMDREMPESLFIFIGIPRRSEVSIETLEAEIRESGMQGCSLPLTAGYRNTFRYVLDVLKILIRIRNHDFPLVTELDLTRLANAFRSRSEAFLAMLKLMGRISVLERSRDFFNPDEIEGHSTPIIDNIHKLSLHGFPADQLREILLIVVGHTTMSRIVFGKLPASSLKPITDRARPENFQEIFDLLRVCRLMSMAEIVAALGDDFTVEQARVLFHLYDDAVAVATDRDLDWDKLHDLRISAMGGVQNKAVRQMMKFFNLFEFLDSWQEYLPKGSFEKEVVCDYEPEQLLHLDEALDLARTAERFKRQFLESYIFGRSYFFRRFLDTEFHGTGHLFPTLGTGAGFVLFWIAVNSADRWILNFNPMLSNIPRDRRENRTVKIRESLLKIPLERLHPSFFDDIRKTLFQGRPAFIFDSGIRLTVNSELRVLQVFFVDVEEDLRDAGVLLTHFESQKLRGLSIKDLQEMERCFSELQSFHAYVEREGCTLQCGVFDRLRGPKSVEAGIRDIERRLREILHTQIFIPEEIHDSLSVLATHCPTILSFILPEFHALGDLVKDDPARRNESLGAYAMRCLEKFQALVVKDRNAFQDHNTFYRLAKQEFGPLAEESVGASHDQLATLESLVARIQRRPTLYKALTFALLFQEIGKLDRFSDVILEDDPCRPHAELGALVLERSDILSKYNLDRQVKPPLIFLVRENGIIGRIILGEEPLTAMEHFTATGDENLLDALVLHAVLAAASVREGLMVSDLLDLFLSFRLTAQQVLRSRGDWRGYFLGQLREKGEVVMNDFPLMTNQVPFFPAEQSAACGFSDSTGQDDVLRHGRQSAALERLFKLVGAEWIDIKDVQQALLKTPVAFIHHQKKLKSIGVASFEKQLRTALKLHDVLASLTPQVRYYFLYCLDHFGEALRIYDFHPTAGFLSSQECVKLLLISFQALHHHFGTGVPGGLVSFRFLSRNIERRHEAVRRLLGDIPFPTQCFPDGESLFDPSVYGELKFTPSTDQPALRVDYHDTIRFDDMVREIQEIDGLAELDRRFAILSEELRARLPYDTGSFEEDLRRAYKDRQRTINEETLREIERSLSRAEGFIDLQEVQKEIRRRVESVDFTEEQRFLLREMFEFHRSRVRNIYLDGIGRAINVLDSEAAATDYWNRLKYDLFAYRPYVGKEYESIIAREIDARVDALKKKIGSEADP